MRYDKSSPVANIKSEIVLRRFLLSIHKFVSDHVETSEQLKVPLMSS